MSRGCLGEMTHLEVLSNSLCVFTTEGARASSWVRAA